MSGNLDITLNRVVHEDQMSTSLYEHDRNSNFTGQKVLFPLKPCVTRQQFQHSWSLISFLRVVNEAPSYTHGFVPTSAAEISLTSSEVSSPELCFVWIPPQFSKPSCFLDFPLARDCCYLFSWLCRGKKPPLTHPWACGAGRIFEPSPSLLPSEASRGHGENCEIFK